MIAFVNYYIPARINSEQKGKNCRLRPNTIRKEEAKNTEWRLGFCANSRLAERDEKMSGVTEVTYDLAGMCGGEMLGTAHHRITT